MTLARLVAPAAAFALLCGLSPATPAAAAPPAASPRAAILGSEAGARGDAGATALETLAALEAAPGEPAAAACARRLGSLLPYLVDVAPVQTRVGALLARGVPDPEVDEALRGVLESLYDARGDAEAAGRAGAGRTYLRRFAVIGPFGASDAAHLHRPYPPEDALLDAKAAMRGRSGEVRWMALPVLGRSAWVSPDDQIRQGGSGVVYSLARVRSTVDRTVALKAWCGESFRVTVNGRDAIVADRERDTIGSATWGTARLAAGWNRILVKVTGSDSFALRLCDPTTGFPIADLEVGDPLEGLADALPPAQEPDARAYRTPYERAVADADAVREGESPGDRAARLSLAAVTVSTSDGGVPWDAHRLHEAALAALGDAGGLEAAWIRYEAAQFLLSFREIPEVLGRRRSRELHEAAVRGQPGFVPSRLRLAEHAERDDHPDRAFKELEAILKEHPSASAELALARLAARRRWERESLAAARRALDRAPRLLEAQGLLEEADRRYGDGEAGRAWARRRLELDASDASAVGATFRDLVGDGKVDEGLVGLRAAIARWPDQTGWRAWLAERLRALGRLDEALVEVRALSKDVPSDDAYPRQEAEILEERGEKAGAIAAYRRSVALRPEQPDVWRALARLEGGVEDFAAPYEPDVDALLKALPTDAELRTRHPKAVAVTVLDHCVIRVRADGTSSSFSHLVYKVLDEKGVAKYGDLSNRGECYEVRAILPDGRVMLPTGLGDGDYNIEGLVPGTVLEQRYLEHIAAGPKGLARFSFRFQDAELTNEPNPVLLSRLVVLAPEGLAVPATRRNFPGEGTTTTKDGVKVTVYEMRDVGRIEHEQGMPDAAEIVPTVFLGEEDDLDDAVAAVLGSRPDTRPTPVLRDAVDKVTKAGMSDVERLRALYEHVNDTVTGDSGSGRGPSATLLQRAGDRSELFAALVRTAGIRSRVGRAMPWDGASIDVAAKGLEAFRLPLLWLEPAGAEPIPFVMGARTAPFGLLPAAYEGSPALLASEAGGEIVRIPTARLPLDRAIRLDVSLGQKADQATARGRIVVPDVVGYQRKQQVQDMSQDARRKHAEEWIAPYLVGTSLKSAEFPALTDRAHPFEIRLEATLSGFLSAQGAGYVVPIGMPKTAMKARFVDRPERTYEFRSDERDDVVEEVAIRLGDAWEVATLPRDHLSASKLGVYALTFRHEGDEVRIRRVRHFHPARYAPHEYKAFVEWCNEIDQAEERKLELRARR